MGHSWEAYNAVVEAIDHNAELWPVRGGAYRTASLIDGNLLALKQNVLANLSRYTLDWTEREMSRGVGSVGTYGASERDQSWHYGSVSDRVYSSRSASVG